MTEPGTLDIEELERLANGKLPLPPELSLSWWMTLRPENRTLAHAAVDALPVLIARIRAFEEASKSFDLWMLKHANSLPSSIHLSIEAAFGAKLRALIKAKEPSHGE